MDAILHGARRPIVVPRPRGLERPISLAEVLDRVLDKGTVVTGEVVISVADIDLIYLGLNVVLMSIQTARDCQRLAEGAEA